MKRIVNTLLTAFGLFSLVSAQGQGIGLNLAGQKDCDQSTFCVDLIAETKASGTDIAIGNASIFLHYNAEALTFRSYTSSQFDGSSPCEADNLAWAIHQYDAFSHPGEFHLVLYRAEEDNACNTYISDSPLTIGTLCFGIKQQGGDPAITLAESLTYFNHGTPNDGTAPVDLTLDNPIAGTDVLACDCPGAGQPCDDLDVYTINDQYDEYCRCQGEYQDSDQDGILDGIDPCVDLSYEAEEAFYSGPQLKNNNPQYYGNGFLDYSNNSEDFTEFTVDITESGTYSITFRYTNITDRNLALRIDGELVAPELSFPATLSYADWQTVTLEQDLAVGPHVIRLQNISGNGPNLDRLSLSICTDCELSGQLCDDGDPCTVDDIYDANCQCGGRIVDVDGDYVADACDPHIGSAANLPLETGSVAAVEDQWVTVQLERSYHQMVVIATPHLPHKDALPVVTRVRNANGHSFELRVQNPSGPVQQTYQVYYLVVEEGTYQETYDGIKMEARRASSILTADYQSFWSNRENRLYDQHYQQPVVLGQVMTANDDRWSVFWASSSTHSKQPPGAQDFAAGKHKGEDNSTERTEEMLGIVVIEQGTYAVRDQILEAGLGTQTIRGPRTAGYTYPLQHTGHGGAVVSASGMRGGNGGWPVVFGPSPLGPTQLNMVFDEDQVRDDERKHTSERVAYLAFEQVSCWHDTDQDSICDAEDLCPGSDDLQDEDGDLIPDGCDPCNNLLVGRPCDDGDPCTILDKYTADCGCAGIPMDSDGDGVCNWDDVCDGGDDNIDLDNDGIPDDCDPNVGDASTMPIEAGLVPAVDDNWQTITLENTYHAMVVVATVQLNNGQLAPVVTRVRNAVGNSFELRVQTAGGTLTESYPVYFVVVEEGVYTEANDGVDMEARRVSSHLTAGVGLFGNREEREYQQTYTAPVVLGQVMTANDNRWSVFWSSSTNSQSTPPTTTSFAAGKQIAGDTITDRLGETLGYIVMEEGQYTLNGIAMEAQLGADNILGTQNFNASSTYTLDLPDAKGAILSASGMDGGDGGWPVLFGEAPFLDQSLAIAFDEDLISDGERSHTTEQVAYLAFASVNVANAYRQQSVTTTTAEVSAEDKETEPMAVTEVPDTQPEEQLLVFPNPASDQITVQARVTPHQERQVVVADAAGQILFTQLLLATESTQLTHQIRIDQLPEGLYFLTLKSGKEEQTVRFIKMKE